MSAALWIWVAAAQAGFLLQVEDTDGLIQGTPAALVAPLDQPATRFPLRDDGVPPDFKGGDGVWTAGIPGTWPEELGIQIVDGQLQWAASGSLDASDPRARVRLSLASDGTAGWESGGGTDAPGIDDVAGTGPASTAPTEVGPSALWRGAGLWLLLGMGLMIGRRFAKIARPEPPSHSLPSPLIRALPDDLRRRLAGSLANHHVIWIGDAPPPTGAHPCPISGPSPQEIATIIRGLPSPTAVAIQGAHQLDPGHEADPIAELRTLLGPQITVLLLPAPR